MQTRFLFLLLILITACQRPVSEPTPPPPFWHGVERSVRYHPEGDTIVITNGERRFNRALYGGNTGFRVETGDLPEFALYMPRLGGTIRLGLIGETGSKWLIDADQITARYHPGQMRYVVEDEMLGSGKLELEVLALHEAEGMVLRTQFVGVETDVQLMWLYGGANDERFHREGDIGADPESVFYLDAEHCEANEFALEPQGFTLSYPFRKEPTNTKQLRGIFPQGSNPHIVSAAAQSSPQACLASAADSTPALSGTFAPQADWQYFMVYRPEEGQDFAYEEAPAIFQQANEIRLALANRVKIHTPDSLINPLGAVLGIAADAIWESPAYHHGAIAWRMQLVGWRGAYVADQLGWHDRGREHFRAFGASQLTEPASGPVTPDSSRNFARQKEQIGTAVFTEGYISRYPSGKRLRAHHYDMNQVYIDALLRHFDWTGDLDFVREMWPVLERHLAWEKRNFDTDGDHLYDSYCSFWASDAVQYSGGGVGHASDYHHYSNSRAAELAELIGKDPRPYREEAQRIKTAMNEELWMSDKGRYAEFKDLLGNQMLHPNPAVWSVYHAIDSRVPDPFQAYQMLQYVEQEIPHIPIRAHGLDGEYYTLSTTNWLPYTWSVNSVALAELMHTSLAFWQGGQEETAFDIWKSALIETMYLGASPGSMQQLSFYDAMRGELYRDFADPIAMTARATVEGLFGIYPHALENRLSIRPGFPAEWDFAELETPDLSYHFARDGQTDRYTFDLSFPQPMGLSLRLKAPYDGIESVQVNGQEVEWQPIPEAIGQPEILVEAAVAVRYEVTVVWKGGIIYPPAHRPVVAQGAAFAIENEVDTFLAVQDPQQALSDVQVTPQRITATAQGEPGWKTAFVQMKQGQFTWYAPINMELRAPVELLAPKEQPGDALRFQLRNNTAEQVRGAIFMGTEKQQDFSLDAWETSSELTLSSPLLRSGSNRLRLEWGDEQQSTATVINWNLRNPAEQQYAKVDLTPYFNAEVDQIFEQRYDSPRPAGPTVQLPLHGIGNWCYPTVEVDIDDSGLRQLAGETGAFALPQGIPFQTPGPKDGTPNVVFTSQWDTYPDSVRIPLSGRAAHAYLLMAGSTNPMQSRLDNGRVTITYTDGSQEVLILHNPDTWWPIEQDYYLDGYAFYTDTPVPPRVHLKTGLITRDFGSYVSYKGFTDYGIEGGAATVLDLPLDPGKELASLTLTTLANDVVIGVLGVSLGSSH